MTFRADELLSAGAGLAATAVVGVAVLVSGVPLGDDGTVAALWWAAYLVYLAVFAVESLDVRAARGWDPRVSMGTLVVAGMAVWLLAPDLGFTSLLFVVTTATIAFALPVGVLAAVVVVQTVAVAVGGALTGWDTTTMLLSTTAYLAFQVFTALVVVGTRREAAARAELAATHADLRAATALLATSSRNDERLRIARDLHDVLGHQLTALALELEVAGHQASGEALTHVSRARDIAKGLLTDVRATVGELRDVPAGLVPTLRAVVGRLPGLTVALDVDDVRAPLDDDRSPLDEERTIAVVRAVQEVLTNTVRHAAASRLEISVVSDVDGLVVRAHDDGAGARRIVPGNGLTGMRERVEELGGEVSFASAPGEGFTVMIRLPAAGDHAAGGVATSGLAGGAASGAAAAGRPGSRAEPPP
ncbi:sensor histidine kinase [Georgenia sp. M64]|uniref:sensor histidine kinase n=1 Tax=Georgenia sp. M64 TaxID=3120520 RepID=UPI0030E03A5F